MKTHLICATPEVGCLPLGEVIRDGRPAPLAFAATSKDSSGKQVRTRFDKQPEGRAALLAVTREGQSEPAMFLSASVYRVLLGRFGV